MGRRVAVIGLGSRAAHMIATMRRIDPELKLAAIADPDAQSARRQMTIAKLPEQEVPIFPSADAMLAHADDYDGVVIGTRCHLHTELATKVAPTRLPLFLEKPVAIDWEQLELLAKAFRGRENTVVVSFPLRCTPLFVRVMEIIRAGRLGTINQVQAVNNVPYGGIYFGEWYRSYEQTGGLWLQKATHDFDYINALVGSAPVAIAATDSRRVFGGKMRPGLRCSACDRTEICLESPANQTARGDDGGMAVLNRLMTGSTDHWCAFGEDIHHHDAGSALIRYEDGTHACYSQNFVTRRAAKRRGATITGYRATLDFDFYTECLRVFEHHREGVERIEVKASGGHGGGDDVLAKSFLDVMAGRSLSVTPLNLGLLSATMCLCARESADGGEFRDLRGRAGIARPGR